MIEHIKWALRQKIQGNSKLVLISLANHAGDTGYCWPSQETIGLEASMTARNVRRVIIQLAEQGYIKIDRRHRRDGSRSSNGYQLLMAGRQEDNLSGGPDVLEDTPGTSKRTTVSAQEAPIEPPKSVNTRTSELRKIQRQQEAEDWEEFWEKYPRKVAKDAAARAWSAAIKRENSRLIVDGLIRLLPSLKAREPRFIPYPATWLNAGSWDDEADPAPSSTSRDGKRQQPKIPTQDEWMYR